MGWESGRKAEMTRSSFALAGCWPSQIPVIPASYRPAVALSPRQAQPSLSPLAKSRYCPDVATLTPKALPWAGGYPREPPHDESLHFFPRNKINQKLFPLRRL